MLSPRRWVGESTGTPIDWHAVQEQKDTGDGTSGDGVVGMIGIDVASGSHGHTFRRRGIRGNIFNGIRVKFSPVIGSSRCTVEWHRVRINPNPAGTSVFEVPEKMEGGGEVIVSGSHAVSGKGVNGLRDIKTPQRDNPIRSTD